jgi:hypothetical protein
VLRTRIPSLMSVHLRGRLPAAIRHQHRDRARGEPALRRIGAPCKGDRHPRAELRRVDGAGEGRVVARVRDRSGHRRDRFDGLDEACLALTTSGVHRILRETSKADTIVKRSGVNTENTGIVTAISLQYKKDSAPKSVVPNQLFRVDSEVVCMLSMGRLSERYLKTSRHRSHPSRSRKYVRIKGRSAETVRA